MSKYRQIYKTVTLAITLLVMALSMVKSELEIDDERSAGYPRKDTLQINQDNLADFDAIGLKQGADKNENIKFLSFFNKALEPSSHHSQKACLLNNARCNPRIPCCNACHNYRNACGDYL